MRVSFGIVTAKVAECREFYVRHFGFTVAADLGWYVHLRSPDGQYNLGLVSPERAELDAVWHQAFRGDGIYLGFEVSDVVEVMNRLVASGVEIVAPLRDEPWGERHFVVRDPAGCLVNVWQRITVVDSSAPEALPE